MEKAKQVAREFLSGDGKHKTTVDQDVRHAVTEETVRPHQHEEVVTAIDKDVHQEHHQTRIQPVTAKETLPEQHTHNVLPVEHKSFEHGDDRETRRTLEREAAQFRDTTTTAGTTHSTSAAPTVSGERIHHHVHEHIQPVIHKETHAPQVVHTTVPIHETHHAAPVHHETTTLPTKSLDEFVGTGGRNILEGHGSHTLREYEGCPKPYNETADAQQRIHGENLEGGHHHGAGAGLAGAGVGAGVAGAAATHSHSKTHRNKGLGRSGSNSSSSSEEGSSRRNRNAGATGALGGAGVGHTGTTHTGTGHTGSSTGTSGTAGTGKPSLMDRLNPRKDADGDGKAGLLD